MPAPEPRDIKTSPVYAVVEYVRCTRLTSKPPGWTEERFPYWNDQLQRFSRAALLRAVKHLCGTLKDVPTPRDIRAFLEGGEFRDPHAERPKLPGCAHCTVGTGDLFDGTGTRTITQHRYVTVDGVIVTDHHLPDGTVYQLRPGETPGEDMVELPRLMQAPRRVVAACDCEKGRALLAPSENNLGERHEPKILPWSDVVARYSQPFDVALYATGATPEDERRHGCRLRWDESALANTDPYHSTLSLLERDGPVRAMSIGFFTPARTGRSVWAPSFTTPLASVG